MIIDSHAHYAHNAFGQTFSYVTESAHGFAPAKGDLDTLVAEMKAHGIGMCIEPGITLAQFPNQVALAETYGSYFRFTVGVHPKHCAATPLRQRRLLRRYATEYPVVALGETGLELHRNPNWWARWKQRRWFVYHIRLADRLGLPLVLHIRQADTEALKLLRRYVRKLRGGVVHCFGGDYETAMAYYELGYCLGIGARLLHDNAMGEALRDAVARVPLDAILLETDAPFILPDARDLSCTGKERRKLRNSSLILPRVLETVAQLRNQPLEEVERAIYENTLRAFCWEKGGMA